MANKFTNKGTASIGTTATTIYTAPASTTATVIGITIANVYTSPVYVDVIVNISGNNYYLIKGAIIAVGGALVPVGGDQKLVLNTGDYIKVVSTQASSIDTIVSVLEVS